MNWDFFWDELMCIDNAYMDGLGYLVGDVSEREMHDAFAMLFGMSL